MTARHFLRLFDFSSDEILSLLSLGSELKQLHKSGKEFTPLKGKCLAMIFEKPSNRTRMSFEVGTFQLGGRAINVQREEIQMGAREAISDTAQTLSRYVDGVMIRAFHHWSLIEFAKYSNVPVINGLSDHYHPCQALADVMTIQEHKPNISDIKVCYIGDGNNVCNSLIEICELLKIQLVVSSPDSYAPSLRENYKTVQLELNPEKAVKNADVIYTDVWTSMGQEKSSIARLTDFRAYSVTSQLFSLAKSDAIFMHCLPAKRGLEVDDSVIDGPRSVVFDQAENRLHAQKAVLTRLLAPEYSR